jgi:single-strand DNA-binding protein
MSEGFNRVQLLGQLGADPELRFTQAGQAVLNMRLACNERYKDKSGEWKDRTEWCNVVLWGPRGEALAKFLRKGATLFVEGSLRTSSFDDKATGAKRYKTEVVAQTVIMAGGKRDGESAERGNGGARQAPAGGYDNASDADDGGLPF